MSQTQTATRAGARLALPTPVADPGGRPRPLPDCSPFQRFDRETWRSLAQTTPLPLTEAEVERLRSLDDPIDLGEVDAVYRPMSALLQRYVENQRQLARTTREFLGTKPARGQSRETVTPFVIGIAGSVAVGKSSTARLLRELMSRWPQTPHVELVTTDGFLLPNAELERRNIMHRKGFPESYDRRALLQFLAAVKSGMPEVPAPVYSHVTYDIVPDEQIVVHNPDILIIEGLNVLQPARADSSKNSTVAISDYFDFSIYVDADPQDIESWYINRFFTLKRTAFTRPDSHFRKYADIPDDVAAEIAHEIWRSVNLANLLENIEPTRPRADLIIRKERDHRVHSVLLRKL